MLLKETLAAYRVSHTEHMAVIALCERNAELPYMCCELGRSELRPT
jgi:hypothetical protein